MVKIKTNPKARLQQLKSLNPAERSLILRRIQQGVPIRPWPFGMPCSASPHVIILGVSPGNSPRPEDKGRDDTQGASGDKPTFGYPPEGFLYEDGTHYWKKVSDLCTSLVRRDAPSLSTKDALALSAHLNLGTGQNGSAGPNAVEDKIVKWVSQSIFSKFTAKILVCFGLNKILSSSAKNRLWNQAGGLSVNWRQPDFTAPFERYKFRLWIARRSDGQRMAVLMWPNHPSRHPFSGGPESAKWCEAKKQAGKLLARHGF